MDNGDDHISVLNKQKMYTEVQLMRLQVWTVPSLMSKRPPQCLPIWVTLPKIPWHYYNKALLASLLLPIGKTSYLDLASLQKLEVVWQKVG